MIEPHQLYASSYFDQNVESSYLQEMDRIEKGIQDKEIKEIRNWDIIEKNKIGIIMGIFVGIFCVSTFGLHAYSIKESVSYWIKKTLPFTAISSLSGYILGIVTGDKNHEIRNNICERRKARIDQKIMNIMAKKLEFQFHNKECKELEIVEHAFHSLRNRVIGKEKDPKKGR